MQKYTSKNTSVNTKRMPAAFNKIDWDEISNKYYPNGFTVLDYGCGRDVSLARNIVESSGGTYIPYDPYWAPNSEAKKANVIVCSNVLNVIDDDEEVERIHNFIKNNSDIYYISVYEGDKSGVGKKTKDDCYQRNQTIESYKHEDEKIVKKMICKSK